jgi:predicted transcriptional regulator
VNSDIRASGHSRIHKDTPALPFCHVAIRAEKPKDSAYPSVLKTVGDRLRARRLDLGLYQKDVAKLLGVDECSVWNWENNQKEAGRKSMSRITAFLDF